MVLDMAKPVALDVVDIGFTTGDKLFPICRTRLCRDTERRGFIHRRCQVGGVPHDFLGHTAIVDAGAADFVALDDHHRPAQFSRRFSNGQSTAAAADHD